jgi:DNA-binding XRE family transcriptional regulator
MATSQNPLELVEGHPFDEHVDPGERARIDERVAQLVAADAAIKDVRTAIGIAQCDVAKAMGVSASSVAQLEGRDIESIQFGTLGRYFAALGYRVHIELESIDT